MERAERNFAYWFESANEFLKMYAFGASTGMSSNAAFQLHQAAERLYVTTNPVFTGYKRKEHNLQKLHEEAAPVHPDIASVLPRSTPEDKHLFDLLRRAYIDARYDESYRITADEPGHARRTGAWLCRGGGAGLSGEDREPASRGGRRRGVSFSARFERVPRRAIRRAQGKYFTTSITCALNRFHR